MQKKYFGDTVLEPSKNEEVEDEVNSLYNETVEKVYEKLQELNFSESLRVIWKLISRMNKYIDESEPWILAKNENNDRLRTVMYTLFNMIYKIGHLISPVLVDSSQEILKQIGINYNINSKNIYEIGNYPVNTVIGQASPIFPRIEVKKSEYEEDLKIQNPINIEDFSKVNINVVEILDVKKVENSDKLLKFIVNTGTEKRQILSGIAKYYDNINELVGKKVLAVLNLNPVKLVNELSQGMLLTTNEKKKVSLIFIDSDVKVGAKVK